jgi:hypothetical protein
MTRKTRAATRSRIGQARLRSADDLVGFFRRRFPGPNWCFRGHAVATWHLASSLERYCTEFDFTDVPSTESSLLKTFYRHVAVHDSELRGINDPQVLLALMQHHGAPTRLLDWTYSPFIATYFALEAANGDAAVWALNGDWIEREANLVVRRTAPHLPMPAQYDKNRDGETFMKLFMPHLVRATPSPARVPGLFLYTVNPRVLNRRLSVQQGLFTAVGDVSRSLSDNLLHYRGARANLVKVIISKAVGRETLTLLHRMGISRASLYPGLDGFTWSLRTKIHALRGTHSSLQLWPY